MAKPKVTKWVRVSFSEDPGVLPEVIFGGNWSMKDINTTYRHLIKNLKKSRLEIIKDARNKEGDTGDDGTE